MNRDHENAFWPDDHHKSREQQRQDRAKLKQVALLWRAHQIYEVANRICTTRNAYGSARCGHPSYFKDVMCVLAGAVAQLKAIESSKGDPQTQTLIGILPDLYLGVDSGEQTRDPVAALPRTNCQGDEDCPEDYYCDLNEGGICVYLFADA